jgi:DNA modification methylase
VERRDTRSPTHTSAFGVGKREGHDAAAFYSRFVAPVLSDDETVNRPAELIDALGAGQVFDGSSTAMSQLPDNSVALVVTSPPYFVGKEYELAVTGEGGATPQRVPATYFEFLEMLHDVFRECVRVLEPGGRIAVNIANLGRKPYRSLSADVIQILQDRLGLLLRGEVIWEKAETSAGSCAWGSFAKASNPVLRDMTERVVIASKGRFQRALAVKERRTLHLPHESTLTNDEFVEVTRDVWRIDAESATRIGHPAPFPIELPRRLIDLYTYRGDLVLDPFAGSGTTLVAAARADRIGIGYDTDPHYAELARSRLATEVQRVATLHDPSAAPATTFDDRQEQYQARAVHEGKKVTDVAARVLTEAGFTVNASRKRSSDLLDFECQVDNADRSARWWVDVVGAFTTSRPGLQRTDVVWKLLGRVNVVNAAPGDPVLVLTPSAPKRGSAGDRAIRAVGPRTIFDVIELYDPAGMERLRAYATGTSLSTLPGFWTEAELGKAAGTG